MINGISETCVIFTGYLQDYFLKNLESGKIPLAKEERKLKIKFEEERKKVQPIYNSEGKLIEYNNSGRHLDFIA